MRPPTIKEKNIEQYLVDRVQALGGVAEKFKSPNKRNVPDRLVLWPNEHGYGRAEIVELKKPGEKPNAGQLRDHARRRRMGFSVYVLDSIVAVDNYIGDAY